MQKLCCILSHFGSFQVVLGKFSSPFGTFWLVLACFGSVEVSFRVVLDCVGSFCFSLSLIWHRFDSFKVVVGQLRFPSKSFLVSLGLILGGFGFFWVGLTRFGSV